MLAMDAVGGGALPGSPANPITTAFPLHLPAPQATPRTPFLRV